ncbi:hypothetical protein H0H93_000809 [Arthromyces matolae]|nr:hypothetical protein H0H93_000809 [Arthromyces matolae]
MSGQITIPIPPNYTVVGSAVSHSQVLHRLIVSLVPNGPQPPAPPQILVGGGENGPFFDEKTRQPAGIFAGPQPAGGQLVVNVENKPSGSASFVPSIFGRPLVVGFTVI